MNVTRDAPEVRTSPSGEPTATATSTGLTDELLGRIAAALRSRVLAQRRAEERLASFAFSERPLTGPGTAPGAAAALGVDRKSGDSSATGQPTPMATESGIDWTWFVGRALRLVGDPAVLHLLEALRDGALPLEALAGLSTTTTTDRVALSDQLGGLATAGLLVRELESNRVSLAPLGEALLQLVADIGQRAEAGAR